MNPKKQRFFALMMLILSVVTLGSSAYYTVQQRQVTECQAKFNDQFIRQINERNHIGDSDRESLAKLVKGVINAREPSSSRKALEEYLKTKDENDADREQHPLPTLPTQSSHC